MCNKAANCTKNIDSFKIDYDGSAPPIPSASSPSTTTIVHPSSDEPSTDSSSGELPGLILFLIMVALVVVIIRKIRGSGRGKYRERRGFPDFKGRGTTQAKP